LIVIDPPFPTHAGYAFGGGGGGTPFAKGGGDGPIHLICHGGDGTHPLVCWAGGDGPTPFSGGGGPGPLFMSPATSEVLNAAKGAAGSQPAPFSFGPGLTPSAPAAAPTTPFEWSDTLNVVQGGGHIYAQTVGMRLEIWDTGDWILSVGFRTFAKVKLKFDIALTDGSVRGLCTISSRWRDYESTSGAVDCVAFGGSSRCISQFFSRISLALRSIDGWGPL
jgi:hypothetical protein